MGKIISPKVEFTRLRNQVKSITPEIFDNEEKFLNLIEGEWKYPSKLLDFISPVDGTNLGALPMLDHPQCEILSF